MGGHVDPEYAFGEIESFLSMTDGLRKLLAEGVNNSV
jgi:hypothetical protein